MRLIEPDWEISGNVRAFLPVERMVLVKLPLILSIYPIKLVISTRQLRKIVAFKLSFGTTLPYTSSWNKLCPCLSGLKR